MFEGIINKSQAIAKAHRERKINGVVEVQAGAVAEYLGISGQDHIRFNIGKPPKGLTNQEFMGRVGKRAEQIAGEIGLAGAGTMVAYNSEASEHITDEFEAIGPDRLPSGVAEGARIVVERIAILA